MIDTTFAIKSIALSLYARCTSYLNNLIRWMAKIVFVGKRKDVDKHVREKKALERIIHGVFQT